MTTCAADDHSIDTNILLDILVPNEVFYEASANALQDAASEGFLVVSDIVYAELCIHFGAMSLFQRGSVWL